MLGANLQQPRACDPLPSAATSYRFHVSKLAQAQEQGPQHLLLGSSRPNPSWFPSVEQFVPLVVCYEHGSQMGRSRLGLGNGLYCISTSVIAGQERVMRWQTCSSAFPYGHPCFSLFPIPPLAPLPFVIPGYSLKRLRHCYVDENLAFCTLNI